MSRSDVVEAGNEDLGRRPIRAECSEKQKDMHVPSKEDQREDGVQKLPGYLLSTLEILSASQNAPQHTAILCSCRFGDYGAGSRTWRLVWQGASASSGIISSLQEQSTQSVHLDRHICIPCEAQGIRHHFLAQL